MTALFEPDKPAHARAQELLASKTIAWLVTTAADGSPRAVPVWFFWHDGVVSILSEPETVKLRHIQRDPRVLVHLDSGAGGNEIVVLRGEASVRNGATVDWLGRHREAYEAKYAAAIEEFGMPLDQIASTYSTMIEVRPTHLLAW